jgi:hypothetical protein
LPEKKITGEEFDGEEAEEGLLEYPDDKMPEMREEEMPQSRKVDLAARMEDGVEQTGDTKLPERAEEDHGDRITATTRLMA